MGHSIAWSDDGGRVPPLCFELLGSLAIFRPLAVYFMGLLLICKARSLRLESCQADMKLFVNMSTSVAFRRFMRSLRKELMQCVSVAFLAALAQFLPW
jgi:hypothetical protein